MIVDANRFALVATSAAPFVVDAKPADASSARLTRIDLATGAVVASHRLGDGAIE